MDSAAAAVRRGSTPRPRTMADTAEVTAGSDPYSAALAYAAHGWRVIPIGPNSKHPKVPAWQNAATTNAEIIANWYTGMYRDNGVGIATGQASGVWVLDVDVAAGKHGDETLEDLQRRYGPLPETVEVQTGSGGRHLYFRHPEGVEIRNNAATRLGAGLDVRGDGGQVLAPPTIHPTTGRPYVWVIGQGWDEMEVADAPRWLLELVSEPVARIETPTRTRHDPFAHLGVTSDLPGDRWAAVTTWRQVLEPDGWTLHHVDAEGIEYWTRPGKDVRDGVSATVGYGGTDLLKVFTSSVAGLEQEKTYSKLGYVTCTRFGGDYSAAARWCGEQVGPARVATPVIEITQAPEPGSAEALEHDPLLDLLIKWPDFWNRDGAEQEWILPPLVPAGRQVALFAPAKTGKSLVVLAGVAALAAGRSVYGQPATHPRNVLYLDYEMTQDDLLDRLEEMGYGPDDDLSHLHYASLPSLPPLNTPEGAKALARLVSLTRAELVVIDTMGRVVDGEENLADTYKDFYRWSGLALKAAGVALLRIDHAGKDAERGQRGSSAKNDDVDLVWRLAAGDDGLTVTRTHARINWAQETVRLSKQENPVLEFRLADERPMAQGARTIAEALDELGVPVDASYKECRAALEKHRGTGARKTAVLDAQRFRRAALAAVLPVDNSGHSGSLNPGTRQSASYVEPVREPVEEMLSDQGGNRSGNRGNRGGELEGSRGAVTIGTAPGPQLEPPPQKTSEEAFGEVGL